MLPNKSIFLQACLIVDTKEPMEEAPITTGSRPILNLYVGILKVLLSPLSNCLNLFTFLDNANVTL